MRRAFAIGFAIAFVAVALAAGLIIRRLEARATPPAPPQPIAFSHREHAGEFGMACLFCHGNAARSAEANIPGARDCYVCHWSIGEGRPDIVKLDRLVEEGEPIRWRKVVELPEHVQFSHEPHVRRGIECATCHGRVEEMDATYQPQELTMGFCVDCHWTHQASNDCLVCHQ
jgi:hypothetical protein